MEVGATLPSPLAVRGRACTRTPRVSQVLAYEITASTVMRPCGYTLRFPRCVKIRDDKAWNECETFDEILRRVNDNQARISSAKRLAEDVAKVESTRRI